MGQLGFFDLNRRYESLTEKNDPLVAIAAMVPFESFRPKLIAALIKGELRSGTQEFGGTQAMGRSRDPQGSGVAGALQSLRRSGGISASRSPLVHAFSRPWSRRRGSRRQNPVALSPGAGQGGRGGPQRTAGSVVHFASEIYSRAVRARWGATVIVAIGFSSRP